MLSFCVKLLYGYCVYMYIKLYNSDICVQFYLDLVFIQVFPKGRDFRRFCTCPPFGSKWCRVVPLFVSQVGEHESNFTITMVYGTQITNYLYTGAKRPISNWGHHLVHTAKGMDMGKYGKIHG